MTQVLDHAGVTAPTPKVQRLDSLDLLRGVGILGILLMNTQCMSMPSSAYMNPTDYPPFGDGYTGWNRIAWIIIHVFADMKFVTIFSIMFGAGIAIQADRSLVRGRRPWAVHYMRMFVLLLFGVAHAHLLWFGDILVMYCLSGMILFPCRALPATLLIFLGVLMSAMTTMESYCEEIMPAPDRPRVVSWLADTSQALVYGKVDSEDYPTIEEDSYRGGYAAEMRDRPWISLENETTSFLRDWFWRYGGDILIGMGLYKMRFFHGAWPRQAYSGLAAFLIPAGCMVTFVGVLYNESNNWDWAYLTFFGEQFNYWGSLITAFGYLCLGNVVAILAAEHGRWIIAKAVIPVRAIGKTALSNYIMQTLIGTTIFYGHGFGYYGYVSRVGLVGITVCIWIFQMIVSTIYVRHFKQGPLEWLWHRAVYFGKVPA